MKRSFLGSLVAALFVLGCGGEAVDDPNIEDRGEVSGVILDTNGSVVRGARVFYAGNSGGTARETLSNSAGSYVLNGLPADPSVGVFVSLRAEAVINGVHCSGVNLAQVFTNDRTKNVSIAVFPENQQAKIHGFVYTDNDFLVRGARVFARPRNADIYTSAVAISDGDGSYTLSGLRSGIAYDIMVNAIGFAAGRLNNQTFTAGQNRQIDFIIHETDAGGLPAPQNIYAQAWTSPSEVSRDRDLSLALENVKQIVNPKRRVMKTRNADNGYPIEVDVYWDKVGLDTVLGYAIQREGGNGQNLVEFLRDPLAGFYADVARTLNQNDSYTYSVATVNSDGDPGPLSDSYTVATLGGLDGETVDVGTLTFQWNAATGAAKYTVYIFDRYPTVIPDEFFTSPEITGNQYVYNGAALGAGTYYYLIVGSANGGDSLTLSRIGSFIVQ